MTDRYKMLDWMAKVTDRLDALEAEKVDKAPDPECADRWKKETRRRLMCLRLEVDGSIVDDISEAVEKSWGE